MGVYIKRMVMPENCADCPVGWCNNLILFSESDKRADNCPLVEVPTPHGRLIDADALADDLYYDAIHFEEEHEMKSNCASWLRSNDNITVIEAEDEG